MQLQKKIDAIPVNLPNHLPVFFCVMGWDVALATPKATPLLRIKEALVVRNDAHTLVCFLPHCHRVGSCGRHRQDLGFAYRSTQYVPGLWLPD